MKILVIGGVAAGTKAAAKLKREDRGAEVRILVKDKDISYAGCGLPYYVGGVIADRGALIVNLPGSPKAVRECLEYILPSLEHGLQILKGTTGNCAR